MLELQLGTLDFLALVPVKCLQNTTQRRGKPLHWSGFTAVALRNSTLLAAVDSHDAVHGGGGIENGAEYAACSNGPLSRHPFITAFLFETQGTQGTNHIHVSQVARHRVNRSHLTLEASSTQQVTSLFRSPLISCMKHRAHRARITFTGGASSRLNRSHLTFWRRHRLNRSHPFSGHH